MTVHTICDTCGMEYDWPGVAIGGQVFCCRGCAAGGPCNCANRIATVGDGTVVTGGAVVAGAGTVVTGGGTVVTPGGTVVAADDDVIIVE